MKSRACSFPAKAVLFFLLPACALAPAGAQEVSTTPAAAAQEAAAAEAEVRELEDGTGVHPGVFISSDVLHPGDADSLGGNGILTLSRYEGGEGMTVSYRLAGGGHDLQALKKFSGYMRCRLTGKEAPVPEKLLELLDAVEDKFSKSRLILLSGYRSRKNNRRTPGAARSSLHLLGRAADIRIPGYKASEIAEYARGLRAGGVGYYAGRGFVHLDVGEPRYWTRGRSKVRNK